MEPVRHRLGDESIPSRKTLRSAAYDSPTVSVFMDASQADQIAPRCQAIQLALPANAVFSHLTSAALRGWRLPMLSGLPIIASTDADGVHLDRRGVYIRRTAVPVRHRRLADGIRIASAEWTIVELAEDLALLDLVCVIDSALHSGQCTVNSIHNALIPGRRGARNLRSALTLVDGKSESWWETALRLLHTLSGKCTETQVPVFDSAGAFVARTDLHIVGTNRYPEYDGDVHRRHEQHRRDLRRDKAMARIGAERFGYTAPEILRSARLILRDAHQALGVKHRPQRLRRWEREFERSSMSPSGQTALEGRLQRFDRRSSPRRAPT